MLSMLKQSPSRNPRSKGLRVKHVLQICVLLATGIWVLHHFKHLYGKKIPEELQNGHQIMKLGRKGLHPQTNDASSLTGGLGNKVDENKLEEMMDEGVGGGDDEIDGHDQERADEEESEDVEDLIDVDDRERDEGIEERESEEKDSETEDGSLLDDQGQNEGEKTAREVRDDQNSRTIGTIFQIGGLRMLTEEKVDAEDIVSMHRKETNGAKDLMVDTNDLDPEVGMNVMADFPSSENAVNNEGNYYKVRLGSVDAASNSSLGIEALSIDDKNVEVSLSPMLVRSLEASNDQSIWQESFDNQDVSSDFNLVTLPDVHSKQNSSFNETVANEQPSSNLTCHAMTEDIEATSSLESVASRNVSSGFREVEPRNATTGSFRETLTVDD